ncbi:MAG: peptidase dimerization domain-containing protein [Pseudomonadota bacterium]
MTNSADVDAALAAINQERLAKLITALVNIHSPTGDERSATRFLTKMMSDSGFATAHYELGSSSGAMAAHLEGSQPGPQILLYAPIDTHLSADDASDVPWVGPYLRPDMKPNAQRDGDDFIVGLGAGNPKSMVAVLVEAALAFVDSNTAFNGTLSFATAGGGMPWHVDSDTGLSSGIGALLSSGLQPDAAVIMKPWDDVYYEHPGLAWFKISVKGDLGYAGIPHGVPGFRNAIKSATKLMQIFQAWLEDYPDRHETDQVRPEGWIGAVRAGWPEKPTFPPATAQFWMDIRLSPGQTVADLCDEVDNLIQKAMREDLEIDADWALETSIPAARTPPDHWIIRSAKRAWESQHGKEYPGAPKMAGQTDAARIADNGIPIVRIGFPFLDPERTPAPYRDGLGGMGVAYLPDLIHAAHMTVRLLIDAFSAANTTQEKP